MSEYAISAAHLSLYSHTGSISRIGAILDDITLQIPAGAVVGLVGRNGSGKSTLLRCLVGLTEPDRGQATLLDCPALALNDATRERIGYAAQAPELFEWMSGFEHLCTIGRAYPRWTEERALILATQLNLPLGTSVSKLSGGDQQKLALVLALAHDPDVLLLDEPMSSLDPLTRRDFMRAMFSNPPASPTQPSSTRERTVIISSHILSDLERIATHVAFMRAGRLQLFDSWDAMLEHLRRIPATADIPDAAIIQRGRDDTLLIDTRHAPAWADAGNPLTLDELFMELNS